jgi:hypothetical protein
VGNDISLWMKALVALMYLCYLLLFVQHLATVLLVGAVVGIAVVVGRLRDPHAP